MNDFAYVVLTQRGSALGQLDQLMLSEESISLDEKGKIQRKNTYQPIEQRLIYIYETLTKKTIDRGSSQWQAIRKLKEARDKYVHRLGKDTSGDMGYLDKSILEKGFDSVREILASILEETIEFQNRFTYAYLAFWSCRTESPFIWDSNTPGTFYVGLFDINPEKIIELYAPKSPTFS
jgi:hypothetical protein